MQIYEDAIKSYPRVPAYWHKNFALVCDKLRHVSPHYKRIALMKTSIVHFRAYLDLGTDDPQKDAIEDAIKQLQDYVNHVEMTGDIDR